MVRELDHRDVGAVAVDLPSVGDDVDKLGDFYADSDHVRGVVGEIGGPVVLCGHSYGGMVITDAAAGPHPHVRRLVYLAAMMPDTDGTVLGPPAESEPTSAAAVAAAKEGFGGFGATIQMRPDGTTIITEAAIPYLFDRDDADARSYMARLQPQNALIAAQPARGAAWRQIPSTYVLCTRDATAPSDRYAAFAKQATDIVELDSAHCPNVNDPSAVADILADAARR